MTAEELAAFVAAVRGEGEQRLAVLHSVDPDTLPSDLRDEYVEALEGWTALRDLTEPESVELHAAVSEHLADS